MSEYILNRASYYQDSLKRFIKSDQPIMLILGQAGSGKTHLLNQFYKNALTHHRILRIDGNNNYQPQQLIACLCQQWDIVENPELTSHRKQLDNLLSQIRQHRTHSVLIITNAHNSNIATLAAICHLASIQSTSLVALHIILSGEVNLEDKINSLMIQTPPCLLLQPLSKKETYQYIKYRLNKLDKSQTVIPDNSVIEKIFEHSGGFPSLINHLTQRWLYHETLKKPNNMTQILEPNKPSVQRLRNYCSETSKSIWKKHTVKITATTCLTLLATGLWIYQHQDTPPHSRQAYTSSQPPQILQAALPKQIEIKPLSANKNSTTTQTPKAVTTISIKPKHIANAKTMQTTKAHPTYVIQLLASRNLANLKHFIKENQLTEKSNIRTISKNHQPLYIITMGQYQSRQQANNIIEHLPETLKKLKPWSRKLSQHG